METTLLDRVRRSLPRVPHRRPQASPHGLHGRRRGSLHDRPRRPLPRDLAPALLVGALVLVSSIAGVGAASGAQDVATSLGGGATLTLTDPVLPDRGRSVTAAEGFTGGLAAAPIPGAQSPLPAEAWVFAPVVVDPSASPSGLATPSPSPKPTPAPASPPKPSTPQRSSFAPLLWPVRGGSLSQGFGCTGVIWEPPYGSCRHYHNGIDIAAPQGTRIVAAAAGTVVFAGWQSNGGGYQVWVSDGGNLYTGYHHLASLAVGTGQRLARGQRIGGVGMTGNATGPHLHFMVSVGPFWTTGRPVDPRRYL